MANGKQEWNSIDSLSSSLPSHVTFIIDSWELPQLCSVGLRVYLFLTSKFSYPIFCNLTHKTGTANGWVATNVSTIWTNQWLIAGIRSYLVLLYGRYTTLLPFTSLSQLCRFAGPKPFCWAKQGPNQHVLTFLHPILMCRVIHWALLLNPVTQLIND